MSSTLCERETLGVSMAHQLLTEVHKMRSSCSIADRDCRDKGRSFNRHLYGAYYVPSTAMTVSPFYLHPCNNPLSMEYDWHHSHLSVEKARLREVE